MKRLTGIAVAVLALAVAGCGDDSGSEGGGGGNGADEPVTMGVSIALHVHWLDSYGKRLAQLAKENDVEMEILWADGTAQKQDEQLNVLLAQKPDVLLYTPLDAEAAVASYARIKQAEVPVVASILPPLPAAEPFISAYRGPNDYEHGEIGADAMAKVLEGQTGEIAMVRGTPGGTDSRNRAIGFTRQIEKVAPNLELVADENSDYADQTKIYDVTRAILKRNPQIIGVFAQNDFIAQGVVKAVKDARMDDVAVTSVGGSCVGFDLVKGGDVYSTSNQDPWTAAEDVFDAGLKIARGTEVEKTVYMELPLVTKQNVGDYKCRW